MGVEGGLPPRQPLPGITQSVAPKGRLAALIGLSYVTSIPQCYYCNVMKCNEVLQIRIDPRMRDRIARLRQERDINVSAWLRRLIEDALDREFPSSPEADAPLTGWRPHTWQPVPGAPSTSAIPPSFPLSSLALVLPCSQKPVSPGPPP